MKCLSRESLQEYIDNEASPNNKSEIELHLVECSLCRKRYDDVLTSKYKINKAMQTISPQEPEIEKFRYIPPSKRFGRIEKVISAAVIISFIVLFWSKMTSNNIDLSGIKNGITELYFDEDPNRLWHEGSTTISLNINDTIIVISSNFE